MCACCMTNIDADVANSNTKTSNVPQKMGAKPILIS